MKKTGMNKNDYGLEGGVQWGDDLIANYIAHDPLMPSMAICSVDSRSTDLTSAGDTKIQDADVDATLWSVFRLKEKYIGMGKLLDQYLGAMTKGQPELQKKVWSFIGGVPVNGPAKLVRRAGIEINHDFAVMIMPRDQPIWGSIFVNIDHGFGIYNEMLRMSEDCVDTVRVEFGFSARSFARSTNVATLMGHEDGLRSETLFISFADRHYTEEWMTKWLCEVICKLGARNVEFHLGEFMPRAPLKYKGWDWVAPEKLRKFKDIEAREDPQHIFTTALSYEADLKLTEEEDICDYCSKNVKPC